MIHVTVYYQLTQTLFIEPTKRLAIQGADRGIGQKDQWHYNEFKIVPVIIGEIKNREPACLMAAQGQMNLIKVIVNTVLMQESRYAFDFVAK